MKQKTAAIVDYGVGNLGSILNMCKRIGMSAAFANEPDQIKEASHIILPGVGAFDAGMNALTQSNLRGILDEQVLEKKVPVLGICLGMQMMTQGSEEGSASGLGWISAIAYKLKFDYASNVKVPHMGWARPYLTNAGSLSQFIDENSKFYFTHSYGVQCQDSEDVLMRLDYGGCDFVASFEKNNIHGVQFHPEKSHRHGMNILRGFFDSGSR